MNADGLPDLVIANQNPWLVYLNTGVGFDASPLVFQVPPDWQTVQGIPQPAQFDGLLTDFNGDGLPDYLRMKQGWGYLADIDPHCLLETTPNYVPHSSGAITFFHNCLFVYFNTGKGFEPVAKRIAIAPYLGEPGNPNQDVHETQVDIVDVNGDGLPDLVQRQRWNDATQAYDDHWGVQLNVGGDLEPLAVSTNTAIVSTNFQEGVQSWGYAPRSWVGGQGSIRTTRNRRAIVDLVDLDGDGILDRVVAGTTGHENPAPTNWNVWRNRAGAYDVAGTEPSQRPNLMTMMSNGFGGTNTIAYRPSTAYDNTGGDQQSDLPFVAWVVEKTRMSDGQCAAPAGDVFDPATNPCIASGNERVVKFRYRDGRFDSAMREFRGFREVERIVEEARRDSSGAAVDDPDNSTFFVYGQDTSTVGRLLSREVLAGAPCAAANPEPDCSVPTLIYREQNLWSTAPIGTGRTQVWLAQTDSHTLAESGFPQFLSVANEPPDAYGNILQTTKSGVWAPDLVTMRTEFALPDSGGGPQVFNRPKHTRTWDASGTLEEQWFYYDGFTSDGDNGRVGAGNVRRIKSRLDASTPNGPETWTWYDAHGNITRVRDANLRDTYTDYDTYQLHPVRTRNHLGHQNQAVTEIDYRWGTPTKVTDANGAVSRATYDNLGRLLCRARPGETIESCPIAYEYKFASGAGALSWMKVTEKQDPKPPAGCGGTATPRPPLWTQYFVDALGRPRHTDTFRIVDDGVATVRTNQTEYDAAGRVIAVRNPHIAGSPPAPSDAERHDYRMEPAMPSRVDPLGRPHRVTHADGTFRTFEYRGNATRTTNEAGTLSESIIDPLGRTVEERVYNSGALYAATFHTYDGAGRLLTTSQYGHSAAKVMVYDSLGRKIEMHDPDSGTWRYGYDAVGNLIWQDDPKPGQHVQLCYDALHRPVRRCVWPDDAPQSHTCAAACPATPERAVYAYDGDDGWAVANSVGRLTRVVDGSGQHDMVAYDARGRVTKERKSVVADGIERHAVFQYAYDTNDRVTLVTYPDGEQVRHEYDDSGQPQVVRSLDRFYVINASYDHFGRLKRVQHGNDVVDAWTYGGASQQHRLATLTTRLPTAPTPYLDLQYQQYDARGLLTQLRDLRDLTNARSNSADYTYDHMGRLTLFDSAVAGADRTYAYDALGNITRHGDQFFAYAAAKPHQISQVHLGSPTGPHTPVTHDENGNRAGKAGQSYMFTADDRVRTITAGGQVTEFLYDHAGRQVARLLGAGVPTVTRYYSPLAETTDAVLTKWYFLGGRRIAMRQTANTAWETAASGQDLFRFASIGATRPALVLLVSRDAGLVIGAAGVLLLGALWWLPSRRRAAGMGWAPRRGQAVVLALLWGAATFPWPLIVRPDAAEAQTDVIRHYHLDHLGSTQVITSATGALLEQLRYSAYGEVRGRWDANNQSLAVSHTGRHEFTGYETHLDSGLQYAGARFYDPAMGSFLTHDPMAQFPNPYTYVHWDPVNSTDPTGAFEAGSILLLTFMIGGIVASAVQSALNGASAQQAIESSLVGFMSGLTFQGGVIGPIAEAFAAAAPYLTAAQIAYGGYSTVEGFRSGQYVQAAFGAVVLAYGVIDAIADTTTNSNLSHQEQIQLSAADFDQRFRLDGRTIGGWEAVSSGTLSLCNEAQCGVQAGARAVQKLAQLSSSFPGLQKYLGEGTLMALARESSAIQVVLPTRAEPFIGFISRFGTVEYKAGGIRLFKLLDGAFTANYYPRSSGNLPSLAIYKANELVVKIRFFEWLDT